MADLAYMKRKDLWALWRSDGTQDRQARPGVRKKSFKSCGSPLRESKTKTLRSIRLKHSNTSTKQSLFLHSTRQSRFLHPFHYHPHLQDQICQSIMKLALSTPLLAFISPFALSAPLSPDQYDNFWRFTPIASDTLDGLNLRGINANGRHFWIGKATSTYCPVRDYPCPPGNETVLDVSSGGASLDVTVPGGQFVYIEPSGALGFAQAHSVSIPDGSLLSNFSVIAGEFLGLFKFNAGGWLACPTGLNGTAFPFKIFAYLTDIPDSDIPGGRGTGCTGLDILAVNYTASSSAAWQYI